MPLVAPLIVVAALTGACSQGPGISACSAQPDVTGRWTLSLGPPVADAGVDGPVVTRSDTVAAELMQMPRAGVFTLGALLWGTLRSDDKGFFDVLSIPPLKANNGSKTGAILGCQLKINIPIAPSVSDDDADQGPLRLQLAGEIVGPGSMAGGVSLLRMSEDPSLGARAFSWTGTLLP